MTTFPEHGIPRIAETPELSQTSISLLTELCFLPDAPYQPTDLIFVFGNQRFTDIAKATKDLLDHNVARKVLITGGYPKNSREITKVGTPEAEEILARIKPSDYPDVQFNLESTSTNTSDNVARALGKYPDLKNTNTLFYVFVANASRRANLTLRKYLPTTELLLKSVPGKIVGSQHLVSATEWFLTEEGKGRVWGEFLRIKAYGERGDIAFGDETRKLVSDIIAAVSQPRP